MRRPLWEGYAELVGKFRDAAEKLRAGDRNAVFPPGPIRESLDVGLPEEGLGEVLLLSLL